MADLDVLSSCIQTYSMVASGGLTFVVLMVVLVAVVSSYFVFNIKSRVSAIND
jgi:hypothetical protein